MVIGTTFSTYGQGITLNDQQAIVKLEAQDKGLLIPRMTQQQRDNITNLVNGLMIYQKDQNKGVYQYNGKSWIAVGNNGPTYTAGDGIAITNDKKIKIQLPDQSPGDMFYFNGNQWVRIPKGNEGQRLTLINGVPTWID
jgi:hypothetical protein